MANNGTEWKLVPVEPTEAMCLAGQRACMALWHASDALSVYRDMLAAAPTPPAATAAPSDDDILALAADFKSASMQCGVLVDEFDHVGFARALLQRYGTQPPAAQGAAPSDADLLDVYQEACEHAERCNQGHSHGRAQALRAVLARFGGDYARGRADGWAAGWDEAQAGKSAQPAEEVVVAWDHAGPDARILAVTRQDSEGRILSVIAEAAAQPAASAEPTPAVNRETVIEWLDALDIEVTDKQLDGLFRAAAVAAQAPAMPDDFLASVKRLVFAARTTGGTAGRDEGLCAALARVEHMLEAIGDPDWQAQATQRSGGAAPLSSDELADKCEAWLRSGGASNVVDAYEAGYRAAESAQAPADGIAEKLKDPNVVHVNMLRGTIAPISFDALAHVLGDEAKREWLAREAPAAHGDALDALDAQASTRTHIVPLQIVSALNDAMGGNEWQGEHSPVDLLQPAVDAIAALWAKAKAGEQAPAAHGDALADSQIKGSPWYPWLARRYGGDIATCIIRETIHAATQHTNDEGAA